MRLSNLCVVPLAVALGCTDYVPAADEALLVVPSSGSTAIDTPIQVRGQLVLTRLRVDYAQPETVEPIARVRVWMQVPGANQTLHELLPITVSEEGHLQTVVPAGLPPALYDVLVEDAYERQRSIAKAFTVIGIQCSDGLQRGERCGDLCAAIEGCECRTEDQCAAICGDGLIKDDEFCDDANQTPDDGCDAECQVEAGWTCSGEPSVCETSCGDGVVAGLERCDDTNQVVGDGCSPNCEVEDGWTCAGGRCAPVCGDGKLTGGEKCDPQLQRIGCGSDCRPREGFECEPVDDPNNPSRVVCRPKCGDGLLIEDEQCDDDNNRLGDGCALCRIEEGWECDGQPSVCHPVCGDGLVRGDEECDPSSDGGTDGTRLACGPDCKASPGYVCQDGVCAPIQCALGTACNDGSNCTHDDICRSNGLCRGIPKRSCLGFCSPSCAINTLLPNSDCCEDNCLLNGQCPDCQTSALSPQPMCLYDCYSSECRVRCRSGTTCRFDYSPSATVNGGSGRVDCDTGAVCAMSCEGGSAGNGEPTYCVMNCAQGAVCMIESCDEADCELNCSDQSHMECQTPQGRVVVCGRPCPT